MSVVLRCIHSECIPYTIHASVPRETNVCEARRFVYGRSWVCLMHRWTKSSLEFVLRFRHFRLPLLLSFVVILFHLLAFAGIRWHSLAFATMQLLAFAIIRCRAMSFAPPPTGTISDITAITKSLRSPSFYNSLVGSSQRWWASACFA